MTNTVEEKDCIVILNKLLGGEEINQDEKKKLINTYGLIIGFLLEQLAIEQGKKETIKNVQKADNDERKFIKNVTSYLGLNSNKILRKIRKRHYTVDKAISDEVFRTNAQIKHKKVKLIYDYCIKKLGPFRDKDEYSVDFDFKEYIRIQNLIKDALTVSEQKYLVEVYDKCLSMLRNYQYLEIGLEKDREKRKELIKNYELTDDEITKSSMMSVEYELESKRKENNKRTERLKNFKLLIINWDKLTENRKESFIREYEITNEELELIIKYNNKNNDDLGLFDLLIKENNVSKDQLDKIKIMYKSSIYSAELYPNKRIV